MSNTKRKRILTNRHFPDGRSSESIEYGVDPCGGQYYWAGEDYSRGKWSFCFPVDTGFVAEKFRECGREFDPTKVV